MQYERKNQRAQLFRVMAAAGVGAPQLAGQIYRPALDDFAAAWLSADFLRQHLRASACDRIDIAGAAVGSYVFRSTRTYFVIALILIVPSIQSRWALQFTANPTLEIIGAISSCLFLTVTVFALVSRLFSVRSVTLDTISAAICAYMLMGVAWAYAFAVLELQHPGSFTAIDGAIAQLQTAGIKVQKDLR